MSKCLLAIYLFISVSCLAGAEGISKAKNAILFIGDGMGPTVLQATRLQFKGVRGSLPIDRFPHVAKVKTYCRDKIVTDSGAGASAMATGQKVPYSTLSTRLPKDFQLAETDEAIRQHQGEPIPTLVELAAAKGKRTGLVTTTEVFDATPAAFYAHVSHRKNFAKIFSDLAVSPLHLLMGGGWLEVSRHQKELAETLKLMKGLSAILHL